MRGLGGYGIGLALVTAAGCAAVESGSGAAVAAPPDDALRPLAEGERGLAIRVGKLLTVDDADRVVSPATILVRDGVVAYAGAPVEPPEGFERLDRPGDWAWPGLVELHAHVVARSWGDINDMVYPVNPDLRVSPAIEPANPNVRRACAGGVTTLFAIPGSGTSIGGFGVLFKTKTNASYEDVVLRDPGGMKAAQNFNPQRGGGDLGTSWCGLGWTMERINDRAAAALEDGTDDLLLRDLKRVHSGELPVLVHCASAEGVADVVRMWKHRYGTNVVVSHGSWDGWKAGRYAAESGVPVNHGPRTVSYDRRFRPGRFVGGAAEYVAAGVPDFSLNTDSPVVPQEELFLQGAMSARFGADDYEMLRAVTANPARSFGIADRVGSIALGRDADIVIGTGNPLDPRTRVELVLIDGEVQYSRERDGQWF